MWKGFSYYKNVFMLFTLMWKIYNLLLRNNIQYQHPRNYCGIFSKIIESYSYWSHHQRGQLLLETLTPSLRRPCIHVGQRVNTHSLFWVMPEVVSTHHSWLWQTLDDVYTRRCFSESEGTRFGAPGQKALPSGNEWLEWVNGFLPNPFIHDLFCWSSRHKFVKTDL